MSVHPISAVLADVNGTLVTKNKLLTERAIQAVNRLRERGVVFTICSGRPPRASRSYRAAQWRTKPCVRGAGC